MHLNLLPLLTSGTNDHVRQIAHQRFYGWLYPIVRRGQFPERSGKLLLFDHQVFPLAKFSLEAHVLGDLRLLLTESACKVNMGRCPHGNSAVDSSVDSSISDIAYDLCHTLGFAMLIASGSDKWESEDQAQYECFNPRVKPFCEVHRKEPTPQQAIKTAVTVAKSPEKAAFSSHDPGETTLVRSVMVKTPYYCRENQSDEEALKIMLDLGLPHLPVLGSNLRVVGVVSMRDLMRSREQKDPPQSGK
jgi:hypothetical protein